MARRDAWFLNSVEESLGFLLADNDFDVWIGSVRGSRLEPGLSWHWRPFTMPDIVKLVDAAALLCPISYLNHISSSFVLRAVGLHLDQMLLSLGIHELNFQKVCHFFKSPFSYEYILLVVPTLNLCSNLGVEILNALCDGHLDCGSLLSAITGNNCCFNASRVEYYLQYEPHASSTKNLHHLFQMIRKGTFSKYDYGLLGNLKYYRRLNPPLFSLGDIPESLPLWIGYGGNDALADLTDLRRTMKELRSKPEALYIDYYGHIDFILGVNAKNDVYGDLIRFLGSYSGRHSC
ncbi:hypothetical protein HPP92_008088 [Vanilla planifolia]|uniref:Uncharacterized protein n=1 Tax=Vanilla planifolia TaxID=51239 RepID=A0A835V3L5_VANPL|nr:hypothetical protein HPP92_008256 [Vanilla planifolia]KAG0485993.1 hypothetical protein HPP92_008088 [Vanilla planifolia]